MTKRFGRNQKRAMRAQIASAEALAAERLENAERSRMEAKYLRDDLDEARDIAGAMSVLFPAQAIAVGGRRSSRITLSEESAPHSIGSADVLRMHSLPVLLSSIHPDTIKSTLHVVVEFADGTWGYAITREALATLPRQFLVKKIAQSLANMIADDLQQTGVRA